jgi:hypothetical protein
MKPSNWTKEEIDRLCELYPDMTAAECSALFVGRTERAVWTKANQLRIRKSAGFMSRLMSHRAQKKSGVTKMRTGTGYQTMSNAPGGRVIRHRMEG